MVGDQNIVEEFVRAVSLHVSEVPELKLVARNEKVAAAAIYNFIRQEANKRYNANVPPVAVNPEDYDWTSVVPTSYRALFRKDFNLMLDHPDLLFAAQNGTTLGNAPKIATLREVVDLVVENPAIFSEKGNTIGYRDANLTNSGITDPSRQALMWMAGCVSALHIVRTLTGPYPISPFLIYLSLETDLMRFINQDFIQQFDTAVGTEFFDLLARVEERILDEETPYLDPFRHHYLEIHGGEIDHAESDAVRQSPHLLQQLVISMLGGTLGIRGFMGNQTSPDFSAFQSGFRDCFDEQPFVSRMLWPASIHARELTALLYNRQPQHPDDVLNRITFKSCGKAEYRSMELRWEKGIRDYVCGVGIPVLARWAGGSDTKRVDFNRPAGRATQVLLMMTSSDLMPATDNWSITFKFRYSDNNGLGASTLLSHAKALSIDIHACYSEANIDLPNPIMKLVTKSPEMFETVLHLIFTGKGFSGG